MNTVLLPDALGQPIHAGDAIIDHGGRCFSVEDTENSFLRQGFLRVSEVSFTKRYGFAKRESHTYTYANYSVVLKLEDIPLDRSDRLKLYREITGR